MYLLFLMFLHCHRDRKNRWRDTDPDRYKETNRRHALTQLHRKETLQQQRVFLHELAHADYLKQQREKEARRVEKKRKAAATNLSTMRSWNAGDMGAVPLPDDGVYDDNFDDLRERDEHANAGKDAGAIKGQKASRNEADDSEDSSCSDGADALEIYRND